MDNKLTWVEFEAGWSNTDGRYLRYTDGFTFRQSMLREAPWTLENRNGTWVEMLEYAWRIRIAP